MRYVTRKFLGKNDVSLKNNHFLKCDDNYFPEHKCNKKKIFMVVTEDLSEEDVVVLLVEELPTPYDLTSPSDPLEVDLVISLNALTSFFAP